MRAQPKETYPEASLPLVSREDSNRPLTGAVPPAADYVIPDQSKVCCRPQVSSPACCVRVPRLADAPLAFTAVACVCPQPQKGVPVQDWILATVLRYNGQQAKYIVLDDDVDERGNLISGGTQQVVPAKYCLPLPLYEPSVYTAYNEFPRGQLDPSTLPPTHVGPPSA